MSLSRALVPLFSLALLAAPVASAASAAKDYRVTCGDDTTARPGKGACSHHGGIKTDGKSGVLCIDGSLSEKMGRGACSGHGGLARKGEVNGKDDAVVKDGRAEKGLRGDKRERDDAREDRQIDRETDRKADRKMDRDERSAGKDMITCKDGKVTTGRLGCFGHGGALKDDHVLPSDDRGIDAKNHDARTGSGGDEPGGVTMSQAGATARCKDGKFSHAQHHTGACSRHGGVAEWLDKK